MKYRSNFNLFKWLRSNKWRDTVRDQSLLTNGLTFQQGEILRAYVRALQGGDQAGADAIATANPDLSPWFKAEIVKHETA